eukprot:8742395-Pyramimonas_sp.AAC.1
MHNSACPCPSGRWPGEGSARRGVAEICSLALPAWRRPCRGSRRHGASRLGSALLLRNLGERGPPSGIAISLSRFP